MELAENQSLRADGRPPAWFGRVLASLLIGVASIIPLGWLLARTVWLFAHGQYAKIAILGVFIFLLAGLLCGALVFPVLRPLRPLSRARIFTLAIFIALSGMLVELMCEYRYVAQTPNFVEVPPAVYKAGAAPADVIRVVGPAFQDALRSRYPPGGTVGYVRWAIASGEMELPIELQQLRGHAPQMGRISIEHRGWFWVLRTVAGGSLLLLGLWWQLTDLKSPVPHSNLIDPDEADEVEREELREAGEPGFCLFEHTADVGLEARGKNWAGLLEQAARGLMATIGRLEADASGRGEKVTVELSATNREELLHDWLAELLFYFETREQMVDRIKFRETSDKHMVADVTLRRIDRSTSEFHREVKAVTYHGIEITPIKRGLSARVILDI